jgi:diguanylate cyclase (GGDEF)-like protein/PAS domain S-box-containing protein
MPAARPARLGDRSRRSPGLQPRLALLLGLVALPPAGIAAWVLEREAAARLEVTEATLESLARRIATDQATLLDQAKLSLAEAGRLDLRSLGAAACSAVLSTARQDAPALRGVAVAWMDGRSPCATGMRMPAAHALQQPHVRQAFDSRRTTISPLVLGALLPVPEIGIAIPVLDDEDRVGRLVLGTFGLEEVRREVRGTGPADRISVLDVSGLVASLHPPRPGLVGTDLQQHPVLAAALAGTYGRLRAPSLDDGQPMLHGFARIRGTDATILLSRPAEEVLAPVQSQRRLAYGAVGLTLLLSFGLAWWAGSAMVLRGLTRLAGVASAAEGDGQALAAAAPDRWATPELHDLHAALSGLQARQAAALARAQEAEAHSRADAAALAEEEARSRAQAALLEGVLETMEQGVIAYDADGLLVAANARFAMYLDLPQEVLRPGSHFIAQAAWAASRGDYGPGDPETLARERYAAVAANPNLRLTRSTPSGRTLDIVTTPMAGGGFLSVYSEVTERAARESVLAAAEEEARTQAVLLDGVTEAMEQGLAAWDAEGRLLVANRRYGAMLGLPDALVVPGRHYLEVAGWIARRGDYGPGDPDALAADRFEHARRGDGHRFLRTTPDGRFVEICGRALPGGGFVTTFTDITERRAAEQALARSEAEFRLLAEASGDVVVRAQLDGRAGYVSPAAERVLGWPAGALLGRRLLDFCHPDDAPWTDAQLEPLRHGKTRDAVVTFRFRRPDGGHRWVEVRCRTIHPDSSDAPLEYVATIRDANDRKAAEEALLAAQERLERMAATDALTGIANRRAFDERLVTEWRRAAREGTSLSLLLLDADRFKLFNDRHGHSEGDRCLRAIAATVEAVSRRPGDLPARYGGEEFALILPGTDEAGAASVAERLRARMEAAALPHEANTPWGVVTLSIGCATVRPAGAEPDTDNLLRRADAALYQAKADGRNRVRQAEKEVQVAAE